MLSKGLAVCAASIIACSGVRTDDWLTARALEKALEQRISLTWHDGTRLDLLRQLSTERQIALWLDRRIDPSIRVDCEIQNVAVLGAAFRAGETTQLGATLIGDGLYVGPGPDAASLPWRLTELKRQIAKLPPPARRAWQTKSVLRIERLARPWDILQTIAKRADATLEGLSAIPHDLYRAVEWPGLTAAEQLAVVLVGFECWPEFSADGRTVHIIPLPAVERFDWSYPTSDGAAAQAWVAQHLPDAKSTPKSKTIQIAGSPHDHFLFTQYLYTAALPDAGAAANGQSTVTLQATASRQAILQQISAKLGVELVVEGERGDWLTERIEIDVQRVSYPELIEQVLAGTPVTFELLARRLRIYSR